MAAKNIQFTKIEIKIARYIFQHYDDRYNARQLARILKINHAHANKLCNILVSKNLLIKEEIGNSAYFTYDYNSKLAIRFMEYILSLEDFPKWLDVLSYNLKKFNQNIDLGLIFGSSIITKNYNDIDVLLMYDKKNSGKIQKIKDEIRKAGLVEKPIRYVDITEKDIMLNKVDRIFYNILAESLIFHNPEKYAVIIKKCRR